MGDRWLIVNADDFGRTPGITEGILQAHREGIVTSTTVMVNLPGARAAVQRAREEAPRLGLGVHLNLTAGRPVLPPEQVSTLVDPSGRFHPIRDLLPRLPSLDLDQVEAELVAQIERFRSWGGEPTHLDSHHHLLYLSPTLFHVLLELAERYRLPIRYPWRTTADLDRLAEAHRVPARSLPSLIAACDALLHRSSVPAPDRCFLSFYGEGATLEHLLDLIAQVPVGVAELMCHPGRVDARLAAVSGYVQGRERELEILTHPRVRERWVAQGVRLTDFRALSPDVSAGSVHQGAGEGTSTRSAEGITS
ncbi:MAG TPA: carbohydrate deacetylase [Chloroflexi bacterium]|nr:carbohydrate deacetylase [Chloroflexota bacterium]